MKVAAVPIQFGLLRRSRLMRGVCRGRIPAEEGGWEATVSIWIT
jgi:hypothetical protein